MARNFFSPNITKYHNIRIEADGESFDSQKEFRRWNELVMLQKAGMISGLRRQVRFELIPEQREESGEVYKKGKNKGLMKPGKLLEREVSYVADFVYLDENGIVVVEDCKGMRTKEYILKRKLMLWRHGIRIKET